NGDYAHFAIARSISAQLMVEPEPHRPFGIVQIPRHRTLCRRIHHAAVRQRAGPGVGCIKPATGNPRSTGPIEADPRIWTVATLVEPVNNPVVDRDEMERLLR